MTDLALTVLSAAPERYAATPALLFRLRATESSGTPVHALALRAQLRIEPRRRPYDDAEVAGLADLFGGRERFGQTLSPFLWTHAGALVPGFTDSIEFDLPVPCTYDFEVTAAKYLHALGGGEVPLNFLFSGTVFTRGTTGFGVEQLPWHLESRYAMPVSTWRDLMDRYFPGGGWIRLDRDTLDALVRFRSERGLISWEETFAGLLGAPR